MKSKAILFFLPLLTLSSCRPKASMDAVTLNSNPNLTRASDLPLHNLEAWFESQDVEKDATRDAIEFGNKFAQKGSRDAHTKAHGCVKATFSVFDNIPDDLKLGFFAKSADYKSWIRFSNSSPEIQPDGARGALGMAIKVMGAQSERDSVAILPNSSQDFLTVNHPTFIVENIKDYMSLQKKPAGYIATHPFTAAIIFQIQARKIANPLETNYFSMSAFAFGKESAVKYRTVPCWKQVTPYPSSPSDSMLSENLVKSLSEKEACFYFQVQKFVNDQKTPVENPMKEWNSENVSKFVTVGKIVIPSQRFNSAEQSRFCENLSFNPWNTTMDHRPLGNINRARRSVYKEISSIRHQARSMPIPNEPTGDETF